MADLSAASLFFVFFYIVDDVYFFVLTNATIFHSKKKVTEFETLALSNSRAITLKNKKGKSGKLRFLYLITVCKLGTVGLAQRGEKTNFSTSFSNINIS
jgi:hypothetical protein